MTLEEALMVSCNDAMMQIAARTGVKKFSAYQHLFGFGSKTGIDLPGEADTSKLIYTADTMKPVDLATSSFGQTYNCTMIQMASAYCSVINGGSYYEPHVVRQILNEQGSVVKKVDPNLVRETVSESTSSFIKNALFRTVTEGTGKAAAVPGYAIAGKTGTAEKIPRKQGRYLLSFCGFAPADDPQVLVYVTIDEPNVADQAHSTFASGVFQKIMQDILPYLNVFPTADPGQEESGADGQAAAPEGITDNTGVQPETGETKAPKVYDTEEYVDDQAADSGVPGELPEGAETAGSPKGELPAADDIPEGENVPEGGTTPEGEPAP